MTLDPMLALSAAAEFGDPIMVEYLHVLLEGERREEESEISGPPSAESVEKREEGEKRARRLVSVLEKRKKILQRETEVVEYQMKEMSKLLSSKKNKQKRR